MATAKKVGVAHALRDIFVAMINKGQLPVFCMSVIAFAVILKLPSTAVATLVFKFLNAAEARYYLGYALSAILTVGWLWHSKYQRRITGSEVSRVSNEKSALQQAELGERIKSSEGRR